MDDLKRMEECYAHDPLIGRIRLERLAKVSQKTARSFLGSKKGSGKPNKIVDAKKEKPVVDLFDGLNALEKKLIIQGLKQTHPIDKQTFAWSANAFKFAHVSDTHIGHQFSKLEYWQRACDYIEKEKCAVILHTGDITEGMAPRPGQIYELEAIGASAQINLAVERLKLAPCPVYAINGNHDIWGYKTLGFDPAQALQDRLPGQFFNLGMHEADYQIGNVKIKLWHGEDGASYAVSYRSQKFVEGLSGGEKPHILLTGHDHKSLYHMCRNVAVFGGGTLCNQTSYMRNKKLACYLGFWIIEVFQNETGVERIKQEWVPFYTEGYGK